MTDLGWPTAAHKNTHAHTRQIDSTSSCSDRMRLITTCNTRVSWAAAVPGRSPLGERRRGHTPDQHSSSNLDEEDREIVKINAHRRSAVTLFHAGDPPGFTASTLTPFWETSSSLNGGCWAHTRITLQGLRHLKLSNRSQQETQVPNKWLQSMCIPSADPACSTMWRRSNFTWTEGDISGEEPLLNPEAVTHSLISRVAHIND